MATYNLDQVAGAVTNEVSNPQRSIRYEKNYNAKAQTGLAVGDIVYFDITVPDWVRTIVAQKRTDTSNADVLTVTDIDSGPTIPLYLPIKTATQVQSGGSTGNTASASLMMQLYPVGNKIRVSLTIVGSVPAQLMLGVAFYDY